MLKNISCRIISSSCNSFNVFSKRWGLSNIIIVLSKLFKKEIFFFLPFFCGRNPKKKNESEGNPETLRAVVTAEAPGIGTISIFSSIHALINLYPGSLIVGVPASEINAILLPSFNRLIILGVFSFFQFSFDLTTLAAILAVIGYSLNDTVVVYDRVRENLRKFKKIWENLRRFVFHVFIFELYFSSYRDWIVLVSLWPCRF